MKLPFPNFLLFLVFLGSLASCRSARENTSTQVIEKEIVKETVRVDTLFIPGAETIVEIPVEVLKYDTVIEMRNQHSSIHMSIADGYVTARAGCDSLQKLVLNYKTIIDRQRENNSTEVSEKRKRSSWWLWVLLIFETAIIFYLLFDKLTSGVMKGILGFLKK